MFPSRKLSLASLFVAASLATCFSQTPAVSHVYVGTNQGVYLYNADSTGSLSLVSGSPFSIAGTATGSNGSYFLSQGTNYVHSYPVASNGAIKGQVSQINTHLYTGNECGTAQGAVLDHTGHVVYSQLYTDQPVANDAEACAALQSFNISSSGALSFLGATEFNTETQSGLNSGSSTLIALSGSGNYAYSAAYDHGCNVVTWDFNRESNGVMMSNSQQYLTVPSTSPGWRWGAWVTTADPTNHLAVAMSLQSGDFGPCGDVNHLTRLASFTIASDGSLSTTNTAGNLITPQVDPEVLNMSPSGQFLAMGGHEPNQDSFGNTQTPGFEVFHFNGVSPITSYSGVLTTTPINEIHWDNSNHVYAVSNSAKKIYVYTVTSSGIRAAPGSPFTIPASPNALVVVPASASCSAPSSAGVHICAPASGSTVSSPVLVQAAATVSGTISNMQLWIDGVKKYTASGSKTINTSVSVAAGTHRFAVLAVNTTGQKWTSAVNATVK
jgi:hypothetical protein